MVEVHDDGDRTLHNSTCGIYTLEVLTTVKTTRRDFLDISTNSKSY